MTNEYAVLIGENKCFGGIELIPMESRKEAEDLCTEIKNLTGGYFKPTVLTRGHVEIDELPQKIQDEIAETLEFFVEANVWFANKEWHVSPGCGISATYPKDDFWCNSFKINHTRK